MSRFDLVALLAGALLVAVVVAAAVRLRWQQEHPERKKKLVGTSSG